MYYAHTKDNLEEKHWQSLKVHLLETSYKSEKFAGKFKQGELGRLVGLLHDLGKYSKKFQERLKGSGEKVDHSTAGAQEAVELYKQLGEFILSYCIMGHHGGLPDTGSGVESDGNYLKCRLSKKVENYQDYKKDFENEFKINSNLDIIHSPFELSFLIRMLFSTLVDADYLNTEEFMNDGKVNRSDFKSLKDLSEKLENKLKNFENPEGIINQKRNEILQACLSKADRQKGLYSLTVPTGGGKTISSLAFAIRHAIKNKQDRVIYAIPYTSIIEQNAQVFREIFGNENVLEHHSNYIFEDKEDKEDSSINQKLKYASENWDAPIIATTNVQFFESLFANKPSKCRKLHNISNSIIILDEAQMIPAEYLIPCIKTIEELVERYNCTVVLCTATQPALDKYFSIPGNEIIPDPQEVFEFFERVEIENIGRKTDEELVSEISELEQILVIVNTKRHALELYNKLSHQDGVYHLSTFMCPMHRKEKLKEIKQRLEEDLPVKVVSTQLIEAGVDIDFPYVYRSSAGIDSIAQSAGRCNREGKLNIGIVRIFDSAEKYGMPGGILKQSAEVGKETLDKFIDILSIEAIKHYFNNLFFYKGKEQLDGKSIMKMFSMSKRGNLDFSFRKAAREFKFIKDDTYPVIIPLDESSRKLVDKLNFTEFPKKTLRQLQPYTVNLYRQDYMALIEKGSIENIGDLTSVLLNPDRDYDQNTGIVINKESEALFDI